ncbi:hypothetical protein PV325_013736 [Microctonus aethiopoides]|uniref:Protein-lysine N-methyltransferase PV328_007614 n=1 Tax=Microctonus aethiopoides TaxID=144406 RepID=A0AA39F0R4_9HYME|nr:hypothetical protein PV325_013736 [Microctonus aethiopoides]KAK0091495.1 hypothetical protein PV326_003121 [Microctonus aethiopoides]KAK0160186.1 hypothetical protein PV328_007614 [Microctonus aethiopoides]
MSDELSEELNPSELGTLDYWEKVYADEINNFEDHGDIGEVWFGKNNAQKVVKYICENLNLEKDDKIIDLGCGNGWTLLQLAKNGFNNLLGVDYSPKAIELARSVLKDNGINSPTIQIKVLDILNINDDETLMNFKLIHDKGTYDAISLNPDNRQEQRAKYTKNVHKLLLTNGYLVISSCNWTQDELINHFKSGFEVLCTLQTPTMKFGGKTGQSVTNIIFTKKKQ